MYTLEQSVKEIKNWADERNLLNPEFKNKQLLKLLEEVGETAESFIKKNEPKMIDGIGDIFVVIEILCYQSGNEDALTEIYDYIPSVNATEQDLFQILFLCKSGDFTGALKLLSDLSISFGYDLDYCVNLAYHEIKDRKGKLVDGSFIKEK